MPNRLRYDIVFVGGSARAAVQSAQRAGFTAAGIDFFSDEDLTTLPACPQDALRQTDQFAESLWPELNRKYDIGRWSYVGGLENQPDLIEKLSEHCPLAGTTAPALRLLQATDQLNLFLNSINWPSANCTDWPTTAQHPVVLLKPQRSAGGLGIRKLETSHPPHRRLCQDWLASGQTVQQFITGDELSATFFVNDSTCQMLGACVPAPIPDGGLPSPFIYRGSMGPVSLESHLIEEISSMAVAATRFFELQGVVGFDLIDDGRRLWLLEINPRYTASVEVIERATGSGAFSLLETCPRESKQRPAESLLTSLETLEETASSSAHRTGKRVAGKAILYAPTDRKSRRISSHFSNKLREACQQQLIADIPQEGTVVNPGEPVLTLFANAELETAVRRSNLAEQTEHVSHQLRERLEQWRDAFVSLCHSATDV